jgi:hypothetical protein
MTVLLAIYFPFANATLLGNGNLDIGFGISQLPYYWWGMPAQVFVGVGYGGSTEGAPLAGELFTINSPNSTTTFQTGPTFDALVRLMTNGVNDQLGWTTSGSMGGASSGVSEAVYFAGSPGVANGIDFAGSTIDRIDFSVINKVASPGSDPNRDEIWTDWNFGLSMNIYGTSAVTEPSDVVLVLTALAAVLFIRQRTGLMPSRPTSHWNEIIIKAR